MTATVAMLLVYSAGLVVAGIVVSRRVRRAADFFVAGRALPGGLVFVTLLAANIGAGSTVGATGLGYRHGLSAWWWSGSAALGCFVLGAFVAPRMHRLASEGGFLTVGDFLEARYDRSVRGLVGVVLWLGSLSILAGQLIAMAWAFDVIAGVPKAWGCLLGGLVMVAYFSGGGLLASAWVNLLELVVLLAGFLLAALFAWSGAGGWQGMANAGTTPMATGDVVGLVILLAPSFIVSPGLIQKTYGARSPKAAGRAALGNAAALAVFAFLPPLLGMATHAARPGLANSELALPTLMRDLLPPWIGGLGLAALFAAEISTADAVLFMLSTSLSKDFYKAYLRPDAGDADLLRVGRWASVLAGGLGVALAMLLPSVVDSLRVFYGLLTAALFVPLVGGLLTARPGASQARRAIVLAVAITVAGSLVLRGRPSAAWLPVSAGIVAALAAFLSGAPRRRLDT